MRRSVLLASLCAVAVLCVRGMARAQAPLPLGLEEVITSVERRYPLIDAARAERRAAEGEALAARGSFDPVWRTRFGGTAYGYYPSLRLDSWVEQPTTLWGANFIGGYRLGLGKFAVYDGKIETNGGGELRLGLQVPLLRNGPIDRRRANIKRADLGQSVADLNLLEQRLIAVRTASQRYWEWVAAGRRLAIARRLLQVAIARDAAVATRVEHGDIPQIERTENARAILQREAQVVSAERSLEQARIELSIYLRDEEGEPVLVEDARMPPDLPRPAPLPPGKLAEDLVLAEKRRPEARRFATMTAQNEVELRLAKNQLWPALDVQGTASYDLGAGSPTRTKPEFEAGVYLEVPLRTRTARGRIDAARAQVRRTERQGDLARDRIVAEVRDAASAMDAALKRTEVARRELELALELERAERQRFDLGEGTLLFVNLREQATAEAAQREVDALADFHRASAAYTAAAGETRS